jgi:hypothetical protein
MRAAYVNIHGENMAPEPGNMKKIMARTESKACTTLKRKRAVVAEDLWSKHSRSTYLQK